MWIGAVYALKTSEVQPQINADERRICSKEEDVSRGGVINS